MPDPEDRQPADHVDAHRLAEKLVHPMELTHVKVVIEGLTGAGKVVRFRSAGTLAIAKPANLALVTVQPLDERDSRYYLQQPEENHLVLVGKMEPDDDGIVYVVEELVEREL